MTEFQRYWRCAHHTSALENRAAGRNSCEWSCHEQELKWWHWGEHPMPKSGGAPREWYDLQRTGL